MGRPARDSNRRPEESRQPEERYRAREETLAAEAMELEARGRWLIVIRSVAFLAAITTWVVGDLLESRAVGWGLTALLLLVFALLVRRHRRVRVRMTRVERARDWVSRGLARMHRRWEELPVLEPGTDLSEHPYALDLDLFGTAGLASLLELPATPPGRSTLEAWLLAAAEPEEIRRRQEAIQELAGDWAHREATSVEASLLEEERDRDGGRGDPFGDFLRWCRGSEVLPRWLVVAAWVLPALTLALLVADLAGPLSARWWVAGLGVQAVMAYRRGRGLHAEYSHASTGLPGLRRYHTLLARWEGYPARSATLRREVERLGKGAESSSAALAQLQSLLHLADIRYSTLYVVFGVGLLWDVHVVRGLLRWRRRHGGHVEGWMEAMGRLEATTALATLAADHPDWAFPSVRPPGDEPRYRATALGHPLLHPAECVRNDVVVGPPGTVLLVTGSNMSGKSTLLRSIGLGAVLAGAGAPVCARELSIPPVRLFTSMRVQDSLEAGVSFFMAELLRLKTLLDAAPHGSAAPEEQKVAVDADLRKPAAAATGDRPLLYLVDEILQGTNSEERQQAGRRLIRHLLRRWAIGAVTTHDLDLHRQPEVEEAARLVHFREALDEAGDGLHFDYLLREGLATTRNALRLAERVGLTDPDRGQRTGDHGSR